MSLGRRIKERRNAAGITQRVLAERMGVAVQTVQNWERGSRTPTIPVLIAIAAAIGVPAVDLFAGAVDDPSATPTTDTARSSSDTSERAA